jgi:glycosyl transferase family 87
LESTAIGDTAPVPGRRLALWGLLAVLALASTFALSRNIDFRVYWYGARAFAANSAPLYGPQSGLGFPLHYRYPPVTYLLIEPVRWLPLRWSGFLWVTGSWVACGAAVTLAVRTARLRFTGTAVAAASAYLIAYAVLAIRAGNVQPYVIAMIFAALLLAESRPLWAAILLALAITFKIWPLFFLPWFLRRGRRAALAWLPPALLVLWLIPLLVWSSAAYGELLKQWYASEFQSATAYSELWYYPGQSLRGILLRYWTTAEPWLKGFPDIHWLTLAPSLAVQIWEVVSAAIYAAVCWAMLRSDGRSRWTWDAIAFALFTLLQPFCAKSSMISMGPPVLLAASLYSTRPRDGTARWLFLGACALSFVGAVAQYRPLLNWLLALGIDFYAGLLLLAALLIWSRRPAQV